MINRVRWLNHSVRTAWQVAGLGMLIEVLVVAVHPVLSYLKDTQVYSYDTYLSCIMVNSVLGLVGALVLFYGVFSLIRVLKVGPEARFWVRLAALSFCSFRFLDVLQTYQWLFLQNLLGVTFDIDMLITNSLLICSGLMILIGLVRALFDAHDVRVLLERRNDALDREVRERKESEQRARASEDRLEVLLNALHSPVFLGDIHGKVLAHNKTFARLFHRQNQNLVGIHLRELFPPDLFEKGKSTSLQVFANTEPSTFMATFASRTYEVHSVPVFDELGNVACVAVLCQDMTDKLREDEERRLLEAAMNNAAESILITDLSGAVVYVNPAFEALTGYARSEVVGRTPAILQSGKHSSEYYRNIWDTLKRGQVWRGHFLNRRKDGALFHEEAAISPILGPGGRATHYIAVKRDVTRERQLEQQFQQAQKIEAIGTLASGIAHDLNNVLGIILGRGELALDALEPEHSARPNVDVIMRTATRSSTLIKHLLSFSRKTASEPETLQMPLLVNEHSRLMRTYLPTNVAIEQRVSPDAGCILADPGEVQQIIVNLCTNANHAMQPSGGTLAIELECVEISSDMPTATGLLAPGEYVRLRIRDTGTGMRDEVAARIFDPFFTTKEAGLGTGLGLAMVHDSVTRANGRIDVYSVPGEGTQFDIFWPKTAYRPPESQIHIGEHPGAGCTALVVDDLEDFRDLLLMTLESSGFNVVAFTEVDKAIVYYREHPQDIDVALLDYMMPGMNGVELARALHEIREELPVVLLSGHSSSVTEENAVEHGFNAVLDKPVSTVKLVHALVTAAALGRRRPDDDA